MLKKAHLTFWNLQNPNKFQKHKIQETFTSNGVLSHLHFCEALLTCLVCPMETF